MLGGTYWIVKFSYCDGSAKQIKGYYAFPHGWEMLAEEIAELFDNARIANHILIR
jgi:hypothetical protein